MNSVIHRKSHKLYNQRSMWSRNSENDGANTPRQIEKEERVEEKNSILAIRSELVMLEGSKKILWLLQGYNETE